MARTIFGIFNLWLAEKQKLDAIVGRDISTDLNAEELGILANQYHVSLNVVHLAYTMWTIHKPTKAIIDVICQKANRLNNSEKVFLFNSVVPAKDMVFKNNHHNKFVCRGVKKDEVELESTKMGIYSSSDDYFFNDKDFGFMSFNELRNSELTFAIQNWFDVEK